MDCGGLYVTADFLYWRSENQGFSYAYEITSPTNASIGKVVRVNPSWDPGFRVGLGWNTAYDFWDILLNYTWYKNDASRSKSSTIGFTHMLPRAQTTVTGAQFRNVSGKTHLRMNMGDLEFGRLTYVTKSVALRPLIGARGGTLHQKFKDQFTNRVVANEGATTAMFDGKNNYWGVGPRAGLHGEWHMGQGFSFLGKAAGALLYGKTQAYSLFQYMNPGNPTTFTESYYRDRFYQLVPNLQFSFGLSWQTCFWCEKMFYRMSASWEANYWWNQFNLPVGTTSVITPMPTTGSQALSMEGLTLNFEFDF